MIVENIIQQGGPYASLPAEQEHQQATINLYDSTTNYDLYTPNELIISNPTFGEIGWVGRPNDDIPLNSNWNESFEPIEIFPLILFLSRRGIGLKERQVLPAIETQLRHIMGS